MTLAAELTLHAANAERTGTMISMGTAWRSTMRPTSAVIFRCAAPLGRPFAPGHAALRIRPLTVTDCWFALIYRRDSGCEGGLQVTGAFLPPGARRSRIFADFLQAWGPSRRLFNGAGAYL